MLCPEDQTLATSLYLSKYAEHDTYEWAYTTSAQYTVKSGYWIATHSDLFEEEVIQPPTGSVELKQEIWKLPIAPKIQHFLWRSLTGALATNTQLRTRTIPANPICQRCCLEDETIAHILFQCPSAQLIWRIVETSIGHHIGFSDDLEYNMRLLINLRKNKNLPIQSGLLLFWTMWRIWKSRNDYLFRRINRSPESEVRKGINDVGEWLDATHDHEENRNGIQPTDRQPRGRCRQWSPPPPGWIKCNFDSGFTQGRSFTATGWIYRDSNGQFIGSGCAQLQSSTSSLQAEALGFLHALQVSWAQGLRYVWFESDNVELVNLINTQGDHNKIGTLLYDIRHWMAKLPFSSIAHVNRERNAAADMLSKKAQSIDVLYKFYSVLPTWLERFLYPPFTN